MNSGTPESAGMAGALPLPFEKGAEVPFHNNIIGRFVVY